MNDDIVLEPGADATADDAAAESTTLPQTDDADSQSATSPKSGGQVFDITEDLNIKPVNQDNIDQQNVPLPQPETPPMVIIRPTVNVPTSAVPVASVPVAPLEPIPPPAATPTYSSMPEAEKTVPGISAVRTYESDIAELMTKKRTSAADMVMAENKKETGQNQTISNDLTSEKPRSGKKYFMLVASILLVGAGIFGAYYLYSLSPLAPSTPVTPAATPITSLIPSDSQKTLAVDGMSANAFLSKIQSQIAAPGTPGTMVEVIPYTTVNGVKTRLTASDAIKLMDIPVPDILARSLTASWMLGIYTDSQNKNSAFVVVTNNFFQNAFAGMLSWESVMSDDLKRYIYPSTTTGIANVQSPATTSTSTTRTASTTVQEAPVTPYFTLRGQFIDKIVKNKDVREFTAANGDTLFLYSFIDNNKLVIAGDEATLSEIVARLEKQAYVR